jgi:tRNA pseudouridine38-40 synthase
MTEITLKCIVRYDGTDFAGWQRQKSRRTVQEELERALSRIASREIVIQGAGRTDSGVHAVGQVFSCHWPGPPPKRLALAVSQMLSPAIRIEQMEEVPSDFNARFDALYKRYTYTFDFNRCPDPFLARYVWHVPYTVDLILVQQCLSLIIGEHDFSGFQSAGSQMKNTIRTIYKAVLRPGGPFVPEDTKNIYTIEMTGNGFLYKMVRNLCGTLIEIGRGRFTRDFIINALERGGPFRGLCAPARGLVLAEVHYKES